MTEPKTLSLPVLPKSIFGRLQITKHVDGCLVFTVIFDKQQDDEIVGQVVQVGLNKKDSLKLEEFINDNS